MSDFAKYRLSLLFVIDFLTAVFAIVMGGLLIQALVSPIEIQTSESLPNTEIPSLNCSRADICINEKAEKQQDLTIQAVENLLKGRILVEKLLVIISSILSILFSVVLAWNAIEFGLILNNQRNLKDSFTSKPNNKNYETDETSLNAHGDPEKVWLLL